MSAEQEGMKVCSRCGLAQPLSEFSRFDPSETQRQPYCRSCRNSYARARRDDQIREREAARGRAQGELIRRHADEWDARSRSLTRSRAIWALVTHHRAEFDELLRGAVL